MLVNLCCSSSSLLINLCMSIYSSTLLVKSLLIVFMPVSPSMHQVCIIIVIKVCQTTRSKHVIKVSKSSSRSASSAHGMYYSVQGTINTISSSWHTSSSSVFLHHIIVYKYALPSSKGMHHIKCQQVCLIIKSISIIINC